MTGNGPRGTETAHEAGPTADAEDAAAPGAARPDPVRALEAVFRPRSIAVIGASRDRGAIGAEIFHNLLTHGFNGPVYPVNPKSPVVQSVRAYPTIADVPGPVDLAVVVVPAARVRDVIEACGKQGVRAAVVISAGFKETGAEGAAREREMMEVARRYGMRVVGPNCLGLINTEAGVRMDATFAPTYPPPGPVAFSSQSGALGLAILEYAAQLNVGVSQFISVGNKADVSGNDLLEFWEHDPHSRVILLYLESFGNPRRFTQIARRVARRKPIIAVKSGRTASGARAASSHTGSLAGADAAVDAVCSQAGIIRTDTIEELFDVAILLANQPVPRGNRVAIVTNAGGPGIMASDACETHGLVLPALEPATVEGLRAFLPPEASTRNPVDMIASATPESYERSVRLLMEDPNVDALLVIFVPPIAIRALEVAEAIVRGHDDATRTLAARGLPAKPVLSCFMGTHGVPEGLRSLQEDNIPSYVFPESAAIALARAVRYGRWLETPEGRPRAFDDVDDARATAVLTAARTRAEAGAAWLRPAEVREVLEAYRFNVPEAVVAGTADEAARAATAMGYPVVLKLVADTVTHKSDVGGVLLDVRDEDEVCEGFRRIEERFREIAGPEPPFGVLVQRLIDTGIEAIIGVTQDASFGPLVMFGLGGTYVELLKDVVFRTVPLTDRDAAEMPRALRGSRIFEGFRNSPPGDMAALEEALLRVSQLVERHPEIAEMDLNPIKILPPGRGCTVVDARIAVRKLAT